VLHTRTAQRALSDGDVNPSGPLAQALAAIGELTRTAQNEMRGLIFDLHRDPIHGGLVKALGDYAREASQANGLTIVVNGPAAQLPLAHGVENQLFGIGREALANVVKHAGASTASVRVEVGENDVVLEIRDDGRGFDPSRRRPGHYGLGSMQGRADEIGAAFTVSSAPGAGTVVRVETGRSL
jgi:signal transduction histidine kinase